MRKFLPLVLFFLLCLWVAWLTIGPVHKSTKTNRDQNQSISEIFSGSPCLTDPKGSLCQKTRDNFANTVTPRQACQIVKTIPRFDDLNCKLLPNRRAVPAGTKNPAVNESGASSPPPNTTTSSGSGGLKGKPGKPGPPGPPGPSATTPSPSPSSSPSLLTPVCSLTGSLGLPLC